MNVLGVDPGIRGGLAIVELNNGAAPQLVDAIDIPVAGVGSKERVLFAYIRGIDWAAIDYAVRLTVLHQINAAITRMRERNGLLPFDDGFPDDRPNAFQMIRTILIPASEDAAPSGAHAG
jgi:hypothetical protein